MPDRRVTVTVDANVARYLSQLGVASAATKAFANDVDHAGHETGLLAQNFRSVASRLKLALDVFGAVGPAFVPIGAVAVPAVSGLANAFGVAALSGGTALLAFKGVGDALDKLNKARINPTTTNLKNAAIAMDQIGHDGRVMVRTLADLKDEFQGLRDSARSGLFPGATEALDSMATRLPEVEVILKRIGEATGDMLAKGAASLASSEWDDFFLFLNNDVPRAIGNLAQATGNLAHGFAELWMNTTPLNDSFTDWLVRSTDAFDEWATKLSDSKGLTEFLAYINEVGPEVADFLGAITMALLDIAEAAAPIGAALLPILTAVLRVISAIADSDLGTPLLALVTLTSTMRLLDRVALTGPVTAVKTLTADLKTMASTAKITRGAVMDVNGLLHSTTKGSRGQFVSAKGFAEYNAALGRTKTALKEFGGTAAKTAGFVGGLMLVQSGLADQMGITNGVMGASIGAMYGWQGALAGGAIGLLFDIADAGHKTTLSVEALTDAMNEQSGMLELAGYQQIATELQFFQDTLDDVGISLADATGAVAEGGPALDAMVDKIDKLIAVYDEYVADVASGDSTASYFGPDIAALEDLRGALTGSNDLVNEAKRSLDAKAAAQMAAAAADEVATGNLNKFNDAIDRSISGMKALNGLLSERQLTRDYNKAWLDLNKTVHDNGEVWDKTKAKGIDNIDKLDAAVAKASERVTFLRKANRDAAAQSMLDKALADLRAFVKLHPKAAGAARDLFKDLRRADRSSMFSRALADLHKFKQENPDAAQSVDRLVAKLKSANGKGSLAAALADLREFKRKNPEAAASLQPLIDKLVEANKKKVKPKIDVDTDSAIRKLGRFQAVVDNLHGNTIVIRTEHMDVRLGKPRATGGPVKAGESYVVGERRPELFVPSTDGRILSSVPSRTVIDGGLGGGKGGGSGGFGSDIAGVLGKIVKALLGSDMGEGQIRGLMKQLDELQKAIGKHNKSILKHNKAVDKWNAEHPDKPQRKHKSFELTGDLKEQAADLLKEIREAERERAQAIRQAFKSFETDLAEGAETIRGALADLRHDLREAGGVWNKAMQHHAGWILELSRRYDRQAATLETQQTILEDLNTTGEDLANKWQSMADTVQGNFSSDLFGNGLGGFFQTAGKDTAQASMFQDVLGQLAGMGLDGPAYQALAESGDIKTAVQLLNSGGVDAFETTYSDRASALTSLGSTSSDVVFGQQIADNNAAIVQQNILIADTQLTMQRLQTAVDRQEAVLRDLAGLPIRIGNQAYQGTKQGAEDGIKAVAGSAGARMAMAGGPRA